MKLRLTKYYLLTIASIGLFIGFWLGFFVFAQIRIRIVCQPSGRVLLDTSRSLREELTLNVNVIGCESIDLLIRKPTLSELIFGGERFEGEKQAENETGKGQVPPPPVKVEEEEGRWFARPTLRELEPTNASVSLTLEIFDACSVKVSTYSKLIEGIEWCVNERYPYDLIVRKNLTHIKVRFYDKPYTETYELNETIAILRLFAQDVSTIAGQISSVGVYGDLDEYFSIGEYTIDNVWEKDPETGVLEITKTVVSFPLVLSKNVPYTDEWTELRFYLNLTESVYFIGNSYVYVTSME